MNRNLFKVCFFIAAMMAFGSTAYGAATTISGTTVLGGGTFSPSNNVQIAVESVATAYDAKSGHTTGGDRQFGTNSTSPRMFWKEKAKTSAPDAGTTSETYASGWTSM